MRRMAMLLLVIAALASSACGKQPAGEKIAVVNWDKAWEAHPQQAQLRKVKQEYEQLLAKRQEQAVIGKTRLGALARLQQLKENSKRSFLAADFQTRMLEQQALEQKHLQTLSEQFSQEVDRELSAEEKKREEQYQLKLFNLRLKLEALRLTAEERGRLQQEMERLQAARDRDSVALSRYKMQRVRQKMEPEIQAVQQRLNAFAQQLQGEMKTRLQDESAANAALAQAPAALDQVLSRVDRELDGRQQARETLENSIKKDIESVVVKLGKERGYSVVFHKYRANVSAADITDDVIADVRKIAARQQAAGALSKKTAEQSTPR